MWRSRGGCGGSGCACQTGHSPCGLAGATPRHPRCAADRSSPTMPSGDPGRPMIATTRPLQPSFPQIPEPSPHPAELPPHAERNAWAKSPPSRTIAFDASQRRVAGGAAPAPAPRLPCAGWRAASSTTRSGPTTWCRTPGWRRSAGRHGRSEEVAAGWPWSCAGWPGKGRLGRRSERIANASARAPRPKSPLERAERDFELERKLVEALGALREPYKTTIHLRFYRDLAPSEIARAQGISVETVKTRLRRGLELLRTRLDAGHGGQRGLWAVPLAAWSERSLSTAPPVASAAPAGAAGTGAILNGVAVMKLAALLVLSVSLTVAVVFAARGLRQPEGPVELALGEDVNASAPAQLALAEGTARSTRRATRAAPWAAPPSRRPRKHPRSRRAREPAGRGRSRTGGRGGARDPGGLVRDERAERDGPAGAAPGPESTQARRARGRLRRLPTRARPGRGPGGRHRARHAVARRPARRPRGRRRRARIAAASLVVAAPRGGPVPGGGPRPAPRASGAREELGRRHVRPRRRAPRPDTGVGTDPRSPRRMLADRAGGARCGAWRPLDLVEPPVEEDVIAGLVLLPEDVAPESLSIWCRRPSAAGAATRIVPINESGRFRVRLDEPVAHDLWIDAGSLAGRRGGGRLGRDARHGGPRAAPGAVAHRRPRRDGPEGRPHRSLLDGARAHRRTDRAGPGSHVARGLPRHPPGAARRAVQPDGPRRRLRRGAAGPFEPAWFPTRCAPSSPSCRASGSRAGSWPAGARRHGGDNLPDGLRRGSRGGRLPRAHALPARGSRVHRRRGTLRADGARERLVPRPRLGPGWATCELGPIHLDTAPALEGLDLELTRGGTIEGRRADAGRHEPRRRPRGDLARRPARADAAHRRRRGLPLREPHAREWIVERHGARDRRAGDLRPHPAPATRGPVAGQLHRAPRASRPGSSSTTPTERRASCAVVCASTARRPAAGRRS